LSWKLDKKREKTPAKKSF